MTKEEKTISSILYTTQYTFNKDNVLTSITYPSGRVINYTPDEIGRTTQVDTTLNSNPKTLASSINYLPYGGITGLTYGSRLRDYDFIKVGSKTGWLMPGEARFGYFWGSAAYHC